MSLIDKLPKSISSEITKESSLKPNVANLKNEAIRKYDVGELLERQVNFSDQLLDAEIRDVNWRVNARPKFGYTLLLLLLAQNVVVFTALIATLIYARDLLKDLQLIFAVLIPATLLETAYSIKVIVQWLFKDIKYTDHHSVVKR